MERRNFLKYCALASGGALIPSYAWALFDRKKEWSTLSHRRLVVIQLAGGNDGLNTVVPFTNDIYYQARPNIAIKKSEVLKLSDELGFNKSMASLKDLYDKGFVSIINNVGYENPNRSHFRSTDIWQTASASNQYLSTGWLGRYINLSVAQPYSGIELDDSLSLILKGEKVNGIATKNPRLLFDNTRSPFFKELIDAHKILGDDNNLEYLYKTMQETEASARYIYRDYKSTTNHVEYPNNPFANQLKTTARLINSVEGTEVFFVSIGGFDAHANQIPRQNKLLKIYSDAINTFVKDLEKGDSFKDTLILTFSEFGRRVKQNAANGTDHGTANNVFIIGNDLKKAGFLNEAPNLAQLDQNGDLIYSVDFRSVYQTILRNWLGAGKYSGVLDGEFKDLGFV